MRKELKIAAAAVVSGMFLNAPSEGAAYLKIGDIKGESQADGHKEWINLLSFSQGLTRTRGGRSGVSRRRGDVVLGDVVVVKEIDKATPALAGTMCEGEVFPIAEIHVTQTDPATGTEQTYLIYELTDLIITSYSIEHQTGGSGGESRPVENVTLNYEAITTLYAAPDPDCRPGEICPPIWVDSTCVK